MYLLRNEYGITGDKHERSNEAGVDNLGDGGSGVVAGGRSGKSVTVIPSACWLSAGLLHDVACLSGRGEFIYSWAWGSGELLLLPSCDGVQHRALYLYG